MNVTAGTAVHNASVVAVGAFIQWLAKNGHVGTQPQDDGAVGVHVSFDVDSEYVPFTKTKFWEENGRLHVACRWTPPEPVEA